MPVRFSFIAKTMHWGFVIIFAYGIFKQVDDILLLADTDLLKFEMMFASLFLILLTVRFVYVKLTQRSAIPDNTGRVQKLVAKAVHLGLYFSLGIIAISGLVIGTLYYYGITQGLLINFTIAVHEMSVMLSYSLIAAHISAAIYHRLRSDGVWTAMVPFWREQ